MSTASKSPRKVLLVAYAVAKEVLHAYAHRCRPKKFTQHQLFAALILKVFLKTDHRGLAAMLSDLPDLRAVIGLDHVPHYTTFQKAEKRLLRWSAAAALLEATISQAGQMKIMP